MGSDQWGYLVRHCGPEELEQMDSRPIRGRAFFMLPPHRGLSLVTKVIEVAMVNLFAPKIGHITLVFTQEALQNQASKPCLFIGLTQSGRSGASPASIVPAGTCMPESGSSGWLKTSSFC